MARAALEVCESEALRADCLCLMGRAYHALGNLNEAFKSYGQVWGGVDRGLEKMWDGRVNMVC